MSLLCSYYMHAYGSVYGITGRVVADVIARSADNLRLLANEGNLGMQRELVINY